MFFEKIRPLLKYCLIIKIYINAQKVLNMSGISINKSWVKESETLYLSLISFIYGIHHSVFQFKISPKFLQRNTIIHRFFNREFASLLSTFLKRYVKKRHSFLRKSFNLVPFIRAFPILNKT